MFGKTTMSSSGTSSIVLNTSLLHSCRCHTSINYKKDTCIPRRASCRSTKPAYDRPHAEGDAAGRQERHAEGRCARPLAAPRARADDRAAGRGHRADEGVHQPAGARPHRPVALVDRPHLRRAGRAPEPHLRARARPRARPQARARAGGHGLLDREPPALLARRGALPGDRVGGRARRGRRRRAQLAPGRDGVRLRARGDARDPGRRGDARARAGRRAHLPAFEAAHVAQRLGHQGAARALGLRPEPVSQESRSSTSRAEAEHRAHDARTPSPSPCTPALRTRDRSPLADSLARREGRRPRPRRASAPAAPQRRSNSAPEPRFSPCRASARPTTPPRRSGRRRSRPSRACHWLAPRSPRSAGFRSSPPRSVARSRRPSRSGSRRPPAPPSPTRSSGRSRPPRLWTCSISAPTPRSSRRSAAPARPASRASRLRSACPATAGSASTPSSPSSRRACRSARPRSGATPSPGSSQVPSSRASWSVLR